MEKVFEIYDEFYTIDPDDSIGIIELFEKNQILLENKTTFKDKEDFDDFTVLLSLYAMSLEKIGRFSKAIKYCDKLLDLIDLKIDDFTIEKNDFSAYWSALASKARALYGLNDYKATIPIVKKLTQWDPENDNFQSWLDTA